jgi:hypothetical protein
MLIGQPPDMQGEHPSHRTSPEMARKHALEQRIAPVGYPTDQLEC